MYLLLSDVLIIMLHLQAALLKPETQLIIWNILYAFHYSYNWWRKNLTNLQLFANLFKIKLCLKYLA